MQVARTREKLAFVGVKKQCGAAFFHSLCITEAIGETEIFSGAGDTLRSVSKGWPFDILLMDGFVFRSIITSRL